MNGHRKVKQIYEYVRNHLREWFPKLPAYATYIQRLNRLPQAFVGLLSVIQNDFPLLSEQKHIFLIDSMPVMTAHARRSSREKIAMPSRKGIIAASNSIFLLSEETEDFLCLIISESHRQAQQTSIFLKTLPMICMTLLSMRIKHMSVKH